MQLSGRDYVVAVNIFLVVFLTDIYFVESQTCTWYPDGYRLCEPWIGMSRDNCVQLNPIADKRESGVWSI
eukprot:TRINITY_DN15725_c0_g1_i1.p2 TRINITY_DN15725_c0_g1~~TRINITY_DN15725_c0_g1_i1.p2  ORF type:complete len:70 (-),score=6.42 TRINITY_DN15725_c0_g1_i1:334-543(-)